MNFWEPANHWLNMTLIHNGKLVGKLIILELDNQCKIINFYILWFNVYLGGHGGRVVTLLPPTSEIGVRFPAQPQVGKLVVACPWSAVYSTEP